MREEARCVIVGGGAMGVGLLYHLAHEGWTDTVLVEKDELSSGSTWHAAGLVPHFIGSLNMAKAMPMGPSFQPSEEGRVTTPVARLRGGAVGHQPRRGRLFKYFHGVLDSGWSGIPTGGPERSERSIRW